MRDLKADLEICNKATSGPYRIKRMDLGDEFTCVAPIEIIGENGFRVVSNEGGLAPLDDPWTIEQLEANAAFIVNARTGWPEAIERAIKAEEENAELREKMQKINDIAVNYQEDGPFIDTVTFAIISEIYDLSLGKE